MRQGHQRSDRLSTKLVAPVIRPLLVKRTRLVERLRLGMKRKLSLVIAPAGYGKTTLLGEWLASIAREDWPTAPRFRVSGGFTFCYLPGSGWLSMAVSLSRPCLARPEI